MVKLSNCVRSEVVEENLLLILSRVGAVTGDHFVLVYHRTLCTSGLFTFLYVCYEVK